MAGYERGTSHGTPAFDRRGPNSYGRNRVAADLAEQAVAVAQRRATDCTVRLVG
jgi:hypothetical protein